MPKALAFVTLAATLLAAQSQPTFRARADLVEVDVVVVDRDGNPVSGLKASDFALRDRGRPETIATFDEVSRATRPPHAAPLPLLVRKDVSDNQTAQADRLVIMVVDDLHIWKERTDRTREIAHKVLQDLGPQSSMAVLFTSGKHSTQVTDDQVVLATAVSTLEGRQSWRRPHQAIDAQTGGKLDPEMSAEQQLAIVQKTQDTKVQDFFDNMTQYKLLQDAAKMLLSSDRRRKAFVLISEGIGKDLSGLFGAMAPAGEAPQPAIDYTGPRNYHDFALIDMMESLRRSNVATYAIDPRGKVESKDLAAECFPPPPTDTGQAPGRPDPCSNGLTDWVSPVRQAQHGLEIMSEASGGFAVTNTDDFTGGLAKIVSDLDHYYLLGFYPSDAKGKGYRPLDVRVPGHPEYRLRFRHGYMPVGSAPSNADKKASEMVTLSSGLLPNTSLPLRLAAVPMPGSGKTPRVVLVLEVSVPRAELQEKDGRLHDTLKYEVLVVDEKKARVRSMGGLEAAFTLSGNSAAGPAPETATYQVTESVEVAPGRYEFRVSATSAKLGRGGSVYLPVEIPDFQSTALGGLAIGYADGARVPLAPRRQAPAQRAARVPTPAVPPPPLLPFAPSLDRVFAAGDTLRVFAEGVARGNPRPMVSVDIVDVQGKIVRSPSPSFKTGDVIHIESLMPLAGLPPGAYIMRATLNDGSKTPAIRESGFIVR